MKKFREKYKIEKIEKIEKTFFFSYKKMKKMKNLEKNTTLKKSQKLKTNIFLIISYNKNEKN